MCYHEIYKRDCEQLQIFQVHRYILCHCRCQKTQLIYLVANLTKELYMGKGRTPPNGPSATGNPSGGGRGNNPPSK